MITDAETNKLYLADCLPVKQSEFFQRFEKVLNECKIAFELLPNTKDIWAKDYMPIQVTKERFIRFKYDPDYLKPEPYPQTKTDSTLVCQSIGLRFEESQINLDGGNVISTANKVIICDKIFGENIHLNKNELCKQLRELFQIDELIFVSWEGKEIDFTGHADGMVRFIDEHTVLINDYSYHQNGLKKALTEAKLEWIPLPCDSGKGYESAIGYYINYLQMEQRIIMPSFRGKNTDKALRVMEQAFPNKKIGIVECDDIAKDGGVLNCISWNIHQ